MGGDHGAPTGNKKIGVLGMVVVGFFWVHGGIYGNEAMLMAAPPAYVFVMLGIVPFVYSLPIALIVAELSTAFPEDGGYVVWVRDACGHVVGSHHAYWVWVIYVVDASIYPVLVANYVDTMVPMGATNRSLLSVGLVMAVTSINLLGTDVMVKFNTLLAILSLLPTLIFTVYGLPELKPTRLVQVEGDVDWSLLVSWILWLYCGFFSLGTLAGELEQPRRTFVISIAVLFPAVLILNTLPLAVALGLDDAPEHYSAGYFNVLAGRLAGAWLDWGFQLGANVCLVGLYNAAVLTAERSLFFLVQSNYAEQMERLSAAQEVAGHRGAAPLIRWLLSTSQTGVAPLYILTNAACAAVLVWMPYTILVEFSMLLSVPSICLFMVSFVALRLQRPDVERPFRVPGGLPVAIAITVVPVAISLAYAAIVVTESFLGHASARQREHYGDLPPVYQVYSMLGVVGLGAAVHLCAYAIRIRAANKRESGKDLAGQVQQQLLSPQGRGVELQRVSHAEAAGVISPRGDEDETDSALLGSRGAGSSLLGGYAERIETESPAITSGATTRWPGDGDAGRSSRSPIPGSPARGQVRAFLPNLRGAGQNYQQIDAM